MDDPRKGHALVAFVRLQSIMHVMSEEDEVLRAESKQLRDELQRLGDVFMKLTAMLKKTKARLNETTNCLAIKKHDGCGR